MIDGIPVHPFTPYKLFFLVTQAPDSPNCRFRFSPDHVNSIPRISCAGRRPRCTRDAGSPFFSSEFKGHGGTAVEVVTGSHNTSDFVKYADMAVEFDLFASRGADFHSPEESHTDLGTLPELPAKLTPVWEPLSDRIHRAVVSGPAKRS